jgi:hypothetical protein
MKELCRQLKGIKYLNVFVLISLFFSIHRSCFGSPVFKNDVIFNSYSTTGLDSIKVERKKLVLAREVCLPGFFNVICFNKPSPYFVHLDIKNFMLSYDSFIYNAYANKELAEKLDTLNINLVGNWYLDTLFNHSLADSNIIEFIIPKKHHNKIRKNVLKNYPTLKYDRKIRFALYELEFECFYVGEERLFLPYKNNEDSGNDHFITAKKYYITNIYRVAPINVNRYIEVYERKS